MDRALPFGCLNPCVFRLRQIEAALITPQLDRPSASTLAGAGPEGAGRRHYNGASKGGGDQAAQGDGGAARALRPVFKSSTWKNGPSPWGS